MGFYIRPEGHNKITASAEVFKAEGQEGQTEDIENPFVRTTEKTSLFSKQIASVKKEGTLSQRTIAPFAEPNDCSLRIEKLEKEWDNLAPDEQAESLIDLQDRVSVLKLEDSPQVKRIQEQVKHLHFQYVFPIARELRLEGEENIESIQIPFARQIYNMAQEIIQQNSLLPFNQLNEMQQQEILRYAIILGDK